MHRALPIVSFLLILLLILALPAPGQIGKQVPIQAGSPEDKALTAISAAGTSAEKLALLDKFMANYGKGDMALVVYEQYVFTYVGDKNYEKAFEFGDKGLDLDPDNFSIALALFRAAQEKGDVDREFRYGEALAGMVARYKTQAPPADTDATLWESRKSDTLKEAGDSMNYVSAALFDAARGQQDPRRQAALLERFSVLFADSPNAEAAQSLVANSYRQMRDYAKMTDFAQKVLAKDADNIGMLLLLADDASERGVSLDEAEQRARRVLDLVPTQRKPPGASDEQWQQRIALQQGLAWTSIGQVSIRQKKDAQALEAFRKAAPLLKSEPFSYARNAYRMGFALLNLKRNVEARAAFTEAASLDTPYKPLAEEKLKSISAGPSRPAKKRP
jgi:tetratricopeptide (TPR) repeat protein